MPITTSPTGSTSCTGQGVSMFGLISSKGRLKMEQKGLKFRGGSLTAAIIQKYTGETITRTTKKQRARAIELIEAEIERLKPIIAQENELGRPLTEQELALHEEDPQD